MQSSISKVRNFRRTASHGGSRQSTTSRFWELAVRRLHGPAIGLDIGCVLGVGAGKPVMALVVAYKVEEIGFCRLQGRPQGGHARIADRSRGQAGVTVGVVRRIKME